MQKRKVPVGYLCVVFKGKVIASTEHMLNILCVNFTSFHTPQRLFTAIAELPALYCTEPAVD